jgi:hypothetical protein
MASRSRRPAANIEVHPPPSPTQPCDPALTHIQVDIQHAPTDYHNLAAMLTACSAGGRPALVRVEGPHDRGGIQQALDLGAAGIMVPTVSSGVLWADRQAGCDRVWLAVSEKVPGGMRACWNCYTS